MLCLHKQHRVELTVQDFELYFDTLLELLEEANNERYRLKKETG